LIFREKNHQLCFASHIERIVRQRLSESKVRAGFDTIRNIRNGADETGCADCGNDLFG
jgi:hypothetical protein